MRFVPVLEAIVVIFLRFERVSTRVLEVAYWATVNTRGSIANCEQIS